MKILVTGFEPFGGDRINPSWEAVKLLPENIAGWETEKLLLPTEFIRGAEMLLSAIDRLSPDAVICTGLAASRKAISIERIAINLRSARIPDNAGYQPQDEPVYPGGREAYFSTLPLRAMLEAVEALGLPGELSLSAGAYVCNDVFYTLMGRTYGSDIKAGFIHVPGDMDVRDIARGLVACVGAVISEQ